MTVSPPQKNQSESFGIGVQVSGLKKAYGTQVVIDDISFAVNPGEIFIVMGPSGSGKSTILRHVMGLEEADSGDITVNGESIHSPTIQKQFRLAMVFQSGALLNSLTVEENVGLYLTEHKLLPPGKIEQVVREKLAVVGLPNAGKKLISELSGGMKKRVAIARALVIDPHLVLYDEPTSELDPVTAATIGKEIRDLNQRTGATSIVVTHDRDLAFGIGHRIAVVDRGHILQIGTPDEIRKSSVPDVLKFIHIDFHDHSLQSP